MAGFKKVNGRPKLKDGKRVKKVDVRFTEEEHNKLLELEKALGISKTELVRKRVLHGADSMVINSRELIRHLDGIGAEMGRSGNNINQLAKHANSLRLRGDLTPAVAEKFNALMEEHIVVQRGIETALRKVIGLIGK